jgi:hypothetical protein
MAVLGLQGDSWLTWCHIAALGRAFGYLFVCAWVVARCLVLLRRPSPFVMIAELLQGSKRF